MPLAIPAKLLAVRVVFYAVKRAANLSGETAFKTLWGNTTCVALFSP
jgi:hypothetical protein